METALNELIRISTRVGQDKTLVLGNYGNTSVKTDDGKYMFIKASGARLDSMNSQQGWRRLRVESVVQLLESRKLRSASTVERSHLINAGLICACDDAHDAAVMPSIESFFHAILGRVVIHLHPECILAVACARNGQAIMQKIFADEKLPPLWIPYAGLGYTSAIKIKSLVSRYEKEQGRKPAIMLMENHGLIVNADSPAAALRLVSKAVNACQIKKPASAKVKNVETDVQAIRSTLLSIRSAIFQGEGRYACIKYYNDAGITAFTGLKNARELCAPGAVTPDEACQLAGAPMWIERVDTASIRSAIQRRIDRGQPVPAGFLVKGQGLFAAAAPCKADETAEFFRCYMRVRATTGAMGGPKSIPNKLLAAYCEPKQQIHRAGAVLSNRLAVVTGAGSGLGRSIAVGLARAGAYIALADIDAQAAAETAELIKNEIPASATLVLHCNVTDEDSVQAGFDKIIDNWGGLDICVNAAGIAPAYSLVDLPVNKWRAALEINLTGYFLMARAAARIMIAQKMGGAIINISSKSGLDASKNNTPYNATKAGELHMARGWALELGSHNIRVNCVCPGNVFEGSKIWNPEYIKVCAQKYGIRPEEVIPFYVSKTALNREIKGQDVADSVVFLASDQARRITGQVLVPDAGQVFVR
ncbi:MAG: SDR family oxidoreductase [Planctomycetaceae bacterium]|nr:SDR family oxidoreductase [Planctomycetaceae bacterium]